MEMSDTSPPTSEKNRYPVEEYDEDMRQLINQLTFEEKVVKEKEKAIRKVLDKMAEEKKANEECQEEVVRWQKELDDATEINSAKRREEIEKWKKVKADAIAEKGTKHAKASSKEIKKAGKMLIQLAREEDTNAPSNEMKYARNMFLRAQHSVQQGKVPSNNMRRARRKLQRLEDDLYDARGKVAVTKMSIRNEAERTETEELLNIFEEREPEEGGSYEDDEEERHDDDDDDEFVIQGNRTNVFCASNLNCAWTDIVKSAKACSPTACLD